MIAERMIKDNFYKKEFRNEYHKLLVNINYTSRFLLFHLQQKLEEFGITYQQFNILKILQIASPAVLSMSKVKEELMDRNSDLTRLVDRLIEKKLTVREQDKINRRKINLKLTEDGFKLLEAVDGQLREFEALLTDLSEKEVITMNKLLTKLREKLV
jgi:MarR family transcriptional repressor of mepA